MSSFNNVWAGTIQAILLGGQEVSPRGKLTKEIPQHTVTVPMKQPVITLKERMLNYRFMAAEAYWILSGDDSVAGISPWNNRIAAFSDNGETFFGAYGPKIVGQLDYVVSKLRSDPDTRQAGLTIWRENPTETKDVPCTVAIFANIRNGYLNLHVFMRSSDVWLGLPYDVFNFSMLGHLICSKLNADDQLDRLIQPGNLYLTAASSHLYETNWEDARKCVSVNQAKNNNLTPNSLYMKDGVLLELLKQLRDTKPGDLLRWWE